MDMPQPFPGLSRRSFLQVAGGALLVTSAGYAFAGTRDVVQGESATADHRFAHPGILHTREDLERMRSAVAAQQAPVYQGFQAMAADNRSSFDYVIRNTGQITSWGRGPTNFMSEAVNDSCAAYQNALMWAVTGDVRHANKARDILNVWSTSLKAITGADGQLGSGLQGFKFVNAAEILRYGGYTGWTPEDIDRCENSFKTVWYRSVSGYALFANGNWDVAALQTIMAIGVFSNDRVMFEDAVRYAMSGAGNGRITNLVVDDTGQGQESGRSQAYAQLAIGLLADTAEVAWNQGVDLYGHANNRILKGFEYNSRFNLGDDGVPFSPDLDRTGKYIKKSVSVGNRGQFQPIYELAYAHYVSRLGLPAPYTERVIFRADGGSRFIEGRSDDHPSWGTLTHARTPAIRSTPLVPPGVPSGLTAHGSPTGVVLAWAGSVEPTSATMAAGYSVKRATTAGGPATTIATGLTSSTYTDHTATTPGQTYYYTVSASNAVGESGESLGVAATTGLPSPWSSRDVGEAETAGRTDFDGRTFTLEASGTDIGGTADQFRFAYLPMHGDGVITARVVYPVSSQYATVGVMMRQTLAADSAHASMLIKGLPLHAWSGVWTVRGSAGAVTAGTGSTPVSPSQQQAITTGAGFPISDLGVLPQSATPLPAPYIEAASDGYRMRRPYWVRLVRKGNTFTGSMSADGTTWTEVGSSTVALGRDLYVGLAACSALGVSASYAETTTAAFDNVEAAGWSARPLAAIVGDLRATTGKSAVDLAWSDLDLSATYIVKRSTQPGGPYRVIATDVGAVGFGVETRYADATGTPGTTYYYVVAASNIAGQAPHSTEASATMPTPPAPIIDSATAAFANVGRPFHFRINATNDPSSFEASGLPAGLQLDTRTGVIGGMPTREGTFTVAVAARNAEARSTGTVTLSIAAPPVRPWDYRDIGDYVLDERSLGTYSAVSIRTPGITSYDDRTGSFTVRGAGSDLNIINQGMTAHYASVPVTGDTTIVARLTSRSGAGTAGRVGLIMAKSLSPFDQMAGTILTGGGSDGGGLTQFVRRHRVATGLLATGGAAPVGLPVWLRLQRLGNTFTAATSDDGVSWTTIGSSDTIANFGDAPYYAGLAVVSRNPMQLCTALFDHVSVTPA